MSECVSTDVTVLNSMYMKHQTQCLADDNNNHAYRRVGPAKQLTI